MILPPLNSHVFTAGLKESGMFLSIILQNDIIDVQLFIIVESYMKFFKPVIYEIF